MNGLPKSQEIAEEAADWLLRLEADGVERWREEFVDWLKHSPRHVEELLLMSTVLHVARKGGRASHFDAEALIREVAPGVTYLPQARTQQTGSITAEMRGARTRRWAFGIAAGLVALAVGLSAWLLQDRARVYETPLGEQRILKLEDGSIVYLNTSSRISVAFDAGARNISLLTGEALFVVARESDRPFQVHTDSAVVRAVGTQFNVYKRDRETTVSVVEGRVKVSAASTSEPEGGALLGVGEQVDVGAQGLAEKRALTDPANAIAWRQRRLVFRSDTLSDIAREFNRYNRFQIHVEGKAALERRLTAVFNADEPTALLKFLRGEPGLALESNAEGVTIREARDQAATTR